MLKEKRRQPISILLRYGLRARVTALIILMGGGFWYAGGQRPTAGEISTDEFGDRVQAVEAGQLPAFAKEVGPKVSEVYRFASSEQGKVLEWIPCYCGCNRIGHRHNRDCAIKSFNSDGTVTFTSHAAT